MLNQARLTQTSASSRQRIGLPKDRKNKSEVPLIAPASTNAKCSPPHYDFLIHRARVITALEDALRTPACWIMGPAGTGKTLALVDYINRAKRPVIWYRVDEGDDDAASLFHDLGLLLPAAARKLLPTFAPEYAHDQLCFARRYIRAWYNALPEQPLIVFDDLHLANSEHFYQALAIMISELPRGTSCICVSRTLPSHSLSDFQLKNQLSIIDHKILDFTIGEAQQLFSERNVKVDCADHAYLLTQGWAAGLVLIADRCKKEPNALQNLLAHAKPMLFHYLTEQVFKQLPDRQQELLLFTSLLPEITASMADQLLGRTDSVQQFAAIYRLQLFITRRDDSELTYLYHDLFREFLLNQLSQRLSGPELIKLKKRAIGLLACSDHLNEALCLAREIEDWAVVRDMLIKHAPALIESGRFRALHDWTTELPQAMLSNDAWLQYWLGVAHTIYNDVEAERRFSLAFALFVQQGNLLGQCLTTARAVLARFNGWCSVDNLQTWVDRGLSLLDTKLQFADPNQELLAQIGFLRALLEATQNKQHAVAIQQVSNRLLHLLGDTALDVNLRVLGSDVLMYYAGRSADIQLFDKAAIAVCADLRKSSFRSSALITWTTTFGAWSALRFAGVDSKQRFMEGETALRNAISIAEHEGLPNLAFGALFNLYFALRTRSEQVEAMQTLEHLERVADPRQAVHTEKLKYLQAHSYLLAGDFTRAEKSLSELFALLGNEHSPDKLFPYRLLQLHCLLGTQQFSQARQYCLSLVGSYQGALHKSFSTYADLAFCLELKQKAKPYDEILGRCLRSVRDKNVINFIPHLPRLAAEVFADALAMQIEVDFCRAAIRHRQLTPTSSLSMAWPWPVKIYVLGRNIIEVDDKDVTDGRRQQRTLELIKLLVASGSTGSDIQAVLHFLWPEETETVSMATFKMALLRTRKLLGRDDIILCEGGRVRLNPELVWVDAWGFLEESRKIADELTLPQHVNLAETLISLYKGPLFGSANSDALYLPLQSKLKTELIRIATALADYYQVRQDWKQAIRAYELGLAQDNLVEDFYRGLMRCYIAMQEPAAAMHTFRRCREMFSIVLGITPAPATTALMENIRTAHAPKRDALTRHLASY